MFQDNELFSSEHCSGEGPKEYLSCLLPEM